jgi:hypothetical protein
MAKIVDPEIQARLLGETIQFSEKRLKLEEAIRTADARNNLLVEHGARKDIESYTDARLVSKR